MTPNTFKTFIERTTRSGPNSCWTWNGWLTTGYGVLRVNGRKMLAHRFSYEYFKQAKIPDGEQIDHLCRNRACVNPDHLESVTQYVNMMRGDGPAAQCKRRTSCLRGHPFDVKNTRLATSANGRTYRSCRECQRVRKLHKRLKE